MTKGKQRISSAYSLGYLMNHPQTKQITQKYLKDYPKVGYVEGTLVEMFSMNMGGGLAYKDITGLMEELDALEFPLEPNYTEKDMPQISLKDRENANWIRKNNTNKRG